MIAPLDPAGAAAPRASVSLSGGSGASAAECNTPTAISNRALRRQISQSDQRRRGRAKRQEDFRSFQPIRQPGYRLSSYQPHRRASGQRQSDRLRTQVTIVEQNWQIRRLYAEPRIERAVEEETGITSNAKN